MTIWARRLLCGFVGLTLLTAATSARAQGNDAAPAAAPPPAAATPAPGDFRLPGRTIVSQPSEQPAAPPPVVVAPPPPVTTTAPPSRTAAPPTAPGAPTTAESRPQATPAPETGAPPVAAPSEASPVPVASAPAPPASPPEPSRWDQQWPWFYYAAPAAGLLLLLFLVALLRGRSKDGEAWEGAAPAIEAPALVPAPAPAPRPDPAMRPWLEIELKAERAQATDTETLVLFELEIRNSGTAPAHNLRIDVKMFNAGTEQDQEIGAFFRTAGRESTKCHLPGIPPGMTGVLHGEVAMPREDMRAVVLDNKYLFIPMLAVNALYDWDEGRTGQTSKSYVVGRELEQPSEKMGAFRVDLGPRIWRTIGQRQHTLARRV